MQIAKRILPVATGKKHGFAHLPVWATRTVAVVMLALAVSLPAGHVAWAADPELTTTIVVDEDSINYETAKATITVSGVDTLPANKRDKWHVEMIIKDKTGLLSNLRQIGGPGRAGDEDSTIDFVGPDSDGAYTAEVQLAKYNGSAEDDHSNLERGLIPGVEHDLTVTTKYHVPEFAWSDEKVTFTTKGTDGCVPHENETTVDWAKGGVYGISFIEGDHSETTLGYIVRPRERYAPINSGRCVHYTYQTLDGAAEGPFPVFVRTSSSVRIVIIKLTGLMQSTTYTVNTAAGSGMSNGGPSYTARTQGILPNIDAVTVLRPTITQSAATARVRVLNPGQDPEELTVYLRYYRTADKDDDPRTETGSDDEDTVKGPLEFSLSSLQASTRYTVEASIASDFDSSLTKDDEFVTLPNKPTSLSVTENDEQIVLSWTKPSGGDDINKYIVQWRSGSETFADAATDGREQTVAHVAGTTSYNATISGLTNGTQYTLQVIAKNKTGQTASDTVTATPRGGADAPTNLSVTPGNEKLTLKWDAVPASGNGGATITGYRVQWKADTVTAWDAATGVTEVSVTGLTREITGLTNGTTYDVRVRAYNGVTAGAYNWAVGDGTPDAIPGVPKSLDVVEGNGELKLTWTEPDNDGSAITGYEVQWRLKSDSDWSSKLGTATLAADADEYTISGLANITEYLVRVRAVNDVVLDDEEGYNWADDDGTPDVIPGVPKSLDVVEGNRELELTWTEPDNDGSAITGYAVQYRAEGEQTWDDSSAGIASETDSQTSITTSSTTIAGLDYSTGYDVRVRGVNSATETDEDDYNWAESTGTTIPDRPTSLASETGNRQVTLSWQEPADLGSISITDYVVQYMKTSESVWSTSSSTNQETTDSQTNVTTYSNTITGLSYNTDYELRVRADNGVTLADEDDYNWGESDGQTVPDSPANLQVVPGDESLKLTWEAPANDGGIGIAGYAVQYKKTVDTNWTSISSLSSGTLTTTIGSLDNGDPYSVRVRATTAHSLDDEEDYNWATGSGTPRPEPIVTGVTVADSTIIQTAATATVAIDNQTGDGQTVHLQYRRNTESDWTTPTPKAVLSSATSETFDLSGLDGNTTYVVRAWLASSSSTIESVEFTTDPVKPGSPTNVRITDTADEEITVAWDAPTDTGGSAITGYKVQWKAASQDNWNTYTERDDDDDQSPYTISENLVNGTAYDVRVIAVNDVGDSDPSGDVEGTPSTTPDPPTGVDVSDYGDRWLEVTWTEPTDKGGLPATYIVQWKSGSDDFSETNQATPVTSPYKITNLVNGTEYTVHVLAVNSRGKSDASNTDTGTPSTKPQPPTGVNVSGYGDGTLTVGWVAPTGANTGGSAITGYKIQWKENATTNWDSPSESNDDDGASPFEVGSLTNGTKYDVRVIAVNANGDSNPSESASGTPSRKPDKLTGVQISDYGDGWLEVTWVAPTGTATGGSPIAGYIVQWKSGADDYDTTNQATPSASPHKITNLENGTEYTAQVMAVNRNGSSDPSDGVSETPRTKPQPPTGVNIKESGDRYLKVGWTAPEDDGGSDLVSFTVQWKSGSETFDDADTDSREQTVTAVENQTDYEVTISSLSNGTEYTVQVIAVNGNRATDNTSDPSNTASGTPSTMPTAPTAVKITAEGDETLTVTWGPPVNDGGSAITKYKVQWKGEDDANWTTPATEKLATDREHVIEDLTNGTLYTVQVFARNDNGLSTEYGQVTGTPSTKPEPPTDVGLTHGDGKLTVSWTAPTGDDTGGSDITGYKVQWKSGVQSYDPDDRQQTPTESPNEISNLDNGTEYTVQVIAVNKNGDSDPSAEVKGTPSTRPQAPADVTITGYGDESLTVSWTAPTGEATGGSAITGFTIQWKPESAADWTSHWEATDDDGQSPFTITRNLTNGTMYDVRVIAVNANGGGEPSTEATGTPSKKPDPPTGVDITDYGDGWLEVTWAAPSETGGSDIKHYIVQWKSGSNSYNATNQATPTESPYRITNLNNGTPYTVRVLAVSESYPDDPSDTSNEDTETPRTIPEAPDDLKAVSGDEELTVSWTAPTGDATGGASITRFIVQWKSGAEEYGSARQQTPAGTSQVIDLLANGTPYSVRVRADNGETAAAYKWAQTTGTPMTVPGAPTQLRAVPGDRQLDVSWVAPTETGGNDIEKFVVQWKADTVDNWDSPGEHTTTDENDLTDTITGLTNGVTYDVRVRADNDVEGQTFQWAYTTGMPKTVPGAPTSLRVRAGDGELTLSWVAPSNKGGLDIDAYVVQWKSGSQEYDSVREATTTELSHIIGSLTNDTSHSIRVRADNGVILLDSQGNEDEDSYNWAHGTGTPLATPVSPPPQVPQPPPPQVPQPPQPPNNPPPPVQRSPTPTVSDVTFANITQTAADATVSLSNAGTAQKTVRLHYRESGAASWSKVKSENTTESSATFSLGSLSAGTTYQVQAWLNGSTPPSGTQTYTFTTLDEEQVSNPSIANLQCLITGQTSATAMVKIADAGTEMKQVFLKHSMDGVDSWTILPAPTITYTSSTSIDLTGLRQGTTYEVAVALTSDFDEMQTCSFTTLAAPSISGIGISGITNTSAVATVNIADAGTAQKTVFLRHREFGGTVWSTSRTRTVTGASAAFDLKNLEPRTTYEVQASLASDFADSKSAMFTTSTPDPSVSGIRIGNITDTSATATVMIAYAGTSQKTMHIRHRVHGTAQWGTTRTDTTNGSSASFDLTALTPQTKYEVQAALSSDFSASKATNFTTLVPDPGLSAVTIGDITQTSAAASITIADAGTAQKTVHLRYREVGTDTWGDPALTATTYGDSVTIDLAGLTDDTGYEVQASLEGSFTDVVSATFATLRYPSLSDIDVTGITRTAATAEITIADPDGTTRTVHLRYRTASPQGNWSSTQTTTSTTADASIKLTGLIEDTGYEVQASLSSDFTVTVSDTFTTLPPDPVVSKVRVRSITQTTAAALIDIANSDGTSRTVRLRYRTTTPRGDWSGTLTATSGTDSASIELTGLTPGTEYDVQASLDGSFPAARTKYDTFTTLRYPSVSSFVAENIGRNGATLTAAIADSHGEAQTVHIRYRQERYTAWRATQQADTTDDIASIRLRGLSSGTEYVAEASLDDSFPSDGTRSVTFTTRERKDDAVKVVTQPAQALNIPLPGVSPLMLRFVAIEGGDNPSPQTFSIWNRVQGTMRFTLSDQQEWLSQQPESGISGGPADRVDITVSVDSSDLASGQYVDIIGIDVNSTGKAPDQVVVVLDVLPPDYVRQFVSRAEGGTVMLPDGTVKMVVEPLAPPKDVDIELMKLNLQAHGAPPGDRERVVVAIRSNTYPPGGDTPEDVAYSPGVALWVMLPAGEEVACAEGRVRIYYVQDDWSLVEHMCVTDESGSVWAAVDVVRLGAFALVVDDSPATPTPVPAAMATPAASVIKTASAPSVRTSLPAQPPTPVPTSAPTAMPVPVAQQVTAPAPPVMPTPTATAVPETVAPAMQAAADGGGPGEMPGTVLVAIGVPMLIGALIVGFLLYRQHRRRNGYYTQ